MNFSLITAIKRNINFVLILSAITTVAYIFSLNNKLVWDDEQFIYNNSYVKNFEVKKIFTENTIAGAGEISTYYRPLTTFSFAVDHKIWGLNPIGFHSINTLLHLGAGILLFFYLKMLNFSKFTSLTIASIFLVHPLQTEAVVYANSRGDSMYAFWTMVALLSFALLISKKYPQIQIYDLKISLGKIFLFSITIVGYLLAILSKEIGITALGLIGLTYLFLFISNSKKFSLKNIFKNTLAVITIFAGLITALVYLFFRTKVIAIPTTQDRYFAGSVYGNSLFVRLHTFTQAIWNYFRLIIFPHPLYMERDLQILEQPISIWLVATLGLFTVLIILSIKEYKKFQTVFIPFGSLWFFFMLITVSGIVPVNGLIYEHWLYVPIIGFFIVIYGLLNLIIPKKHLAKTKELLKNILPIIIIIYVGMTIRQNYIWGNPIRFYNYTLSFSKSPRIQNNLAMSYAEIGDYQNAIANYNKAIELGDYYPQTHHNLANTYLAMGEIDLAIKEFATAIRMNDNFMPSYIILIKIFQQEKSYENITPLIDKLIQSSPDNLEYQFIKALNLLDLNQTKEGLKILEELLLKPNLNTKFKLIVSDTIKRYK